MPWVPELFSAPVLERVLEKRRRTELVAMPFFDGLVAGEPDALIESFAGEPDLHDPIRGRIEGVHAFRAYVAEMSAWLAQRNVSIEDVDHVVLEARGFEEVVLHLDGDQGRVEVPFAIVADHPSDARLAQLRLYYSSRLLTGRHANRSPLLRPDPDLREPEVVAEYRRSLAAGGGGIELEPCAVVDDGRTCALEFNMVRPAEQPHAGVAVFVRGRSKRPAAVRVYADA